MYVFADFLPISAILTKSQVFEPSEIRKRMLTEDDDLIRGQDIPERMQLAVSSLMESSNLSLHVQLTQEDIGGAAMWVTQRISDQKNTDFFTPVGQYQHLKGSLVMAVTFTLQELFLDEYEVPYIWAHKQDRLRHFDVDDIRSNEELLNLKELWRINTLGKKYRSLLERIRALNALYDRLQVKDEYYEEDIHAQIDSVEVVADATEWLSMKYKDKKQDSSVDFRFHDDDEATDNKKRKTPSRISAYEIVKKSVVSKLAEVRHILDLLPVVADDMLLEIWYCTASSGSQFPGRLSCPFCQRSGPQSYCVC
jgi:transcription elongation factor SPT6